MKRICIKQLSKKIDQLVQGRIVFPVEQKSNTSQSISKIITFLNEADFMLGIAKYYNIPSVTQIRAEFNYLPAKKINELILDRQKIHYADVNPKEFKRGAKESMIEYIERMVKKYFEITEVHCQLTKTLDAKIRKYRGLSYQSFAIESLIDSVLA